MFGLIWWGSSLLFYAGLVYGAIREYNDSGSFYISINDFTGWFLMGLLGPIALTALVFSAFGNITIAFKNKDKY